MIPMNSVLRFTRIFLIASVFCTATSADSKRVLVQSTTSTGNSGFYDYLLPLFKQETGITVHVVSVGTGQAIRNARNCDGDVLLVHSKPAEQAFVADGFGVARFDLMYNDFVIIGPRNDPAGLRSSNSITQAFQSIASKKQPFASRGDDSGTHKKELSLWQKAGVGLDEGSRNWYRSTGSGMGATINTAIGIGAYALTDRASWISYKNQQDYSIVFEGDEALFNQYGVILVNSEKCPNVASVEGQQFIDWLLSDTTQTAIGEFEMNGQQLFYPNATGQP